MLSRFALAAFVLPFIVGCPQPTQPAAAPNASPAIAATSPAGQKTTPAELIGGWKTKEFLSNGKTPKEGPWWLGVEFRKGLDVIFVMPPFAEGEPLRQKRWKVAYDDAGHGLEFFEEIGTRRNVIYKGFWQIKDGRLGLFVNMGDQPPTKADWSDAEFIVQHERAE